MSFYGDKVPLKLYDNNEEDTLFIGLYFQEDYNTFINHTGKKVIFWNGSDVLRLLYNPDWQAIIKNDKKTTHYCHNTQLHSELMSMGIDSHIIPLFFGDKGKYTLSYEPSDPLHFYMSAHPGREEEYGVPIFIELASFYPDIKFHIYGVKGESRANITFHGQIPEQQMDEETKRYHLCLRMNKHDGESQIVIKSRLMGLHVIIETTLSSIIQRITTTDFGGPGEFERDSVTDIHEFIEKIQRD